MTGAVFRAIEVSEQFLCNLQFVLDEQEDESKASNLEAVNAANEVFVVRKSPIANESTARSSKKPGQLERVRRSKILSIGERQGRHRPTSIFTPPDDGDEYKSKRPKLHKQHTQSKPASAVTAPMQDEVVDDKGITKTIRGSQKRGPGRPKSQVTSFADSQKSGHQLRSRKTKPVPSSKDHPVPQEKRANRRRREGPYSASPDTQQSSRSDHDDFEKPSEEQNALVTDVIVDQRLTNNHESQAHHQEFEEEHTEPTKHAKNSELPSEPSNDNESESTQKSRTSAVGDAKYIEVEESPGAEDEESESEPGVDVDADAEADQELADLELFGHHNDWKRVLAAKRSIGVSKRKEKQSKDVPKLEGQLVKDLIAEARGCIEAYESIASGCSTSMDEQEKVQGSRRLQKALEDLQRRVRDLSEDRCDKKKQTIRGIYAHLIPEVIELVGKALKVRTVQLREAENFGVLEEVIDVLNIPVVLCYKARHWITKPNADTAIIKPTVQIQPLIISIHGTFQKQLQKRYRNRAQRLGQSDAIEERRARARKEKEAAEKKARIAAEYARARSEARAQNPHLYKTKYPTQSPKRRRQQVSSTVIWTPDMDRELLSALLSPSNTGTTGNHASTLPRIRLTVL
ncbi:MAG: hypothetical protein Q9174_001971 [Haloplaca sp. 1 TL-2023]